MTSDEIKHKFANNLRAAMDDADVSVSYLSSITGLSRRTINRYLDGTTLPRLDDLEILAEALGVTRYKLLIYT